MCIVSAVSDRYSPLFPDPNVWTWPSTSPPPTIKPITVPTPSPKEFTPEQLRQLIDLFRRDWASAEEFDELTGQPDCVDPEKAKIVDRVNRLEQKLNELAEDLRDLAEEIDDAVDAGRVD